MDPKTPLRDVMTKHVIALHEDDSLRIVDKTFEKHNFRHIPILDSRLDIVGIISKEDILRLISVRKEFTDKEFGSIKARDFMSRDLVMARPEDSVEMAARIFARNHFHALPIVDDGKLVGMVTTQDLIVFAFGLERE